MLDVTAPGQMLPIWFVGPFALLMMVLVVWHLRRMAQDEMPESRRRIRSANGLLLLLLPILMTYALSVTSPREPIVFLWAWSAVSLLVLLLVVLAVVDVGNTLRLHRRHVRTVRAQWRELRTAIRADLEGRPSDRYSQATLSDARARSTTQSRGPG